jgi:hypothetical protein
MALLVVAITLQRRQNLMIEQLAPFVMWAAHRDVAGYSAPSHQQFETNLRALCEASETPAK